MGRLTVVVALVWGAYVVWGRRCGSSRGWRRAGRSGASARRRDRAARNEGGGVAADAAHLLQQGRQYAARDRRRRPLRRRDGGGGARVGRGDDGAGTTRVVTSPALPPGGPGKSGRSRTASKRRRHCTRMGVAHDADIRHEPGVLERLLATAVHEDRDFLSVMARLRCETAWERLLIPAFRTSSRGSTRSRGSPMIGPRRRRRPADAC